MHIKPGMKRTRGGGGGIENHVTQSSLDDISVILCGQLLLYVHGNAVYKDLKPARPQFKNAKALAHGPLVA